MQNKASDITELKPVWLKAAVLGGLWASIEIIIGSFFHNLRFPFAGTMLSANATLLMIAFYQIWPAKGLIWRAGLIAALMKSVSPSAIILGPMIGILSEALIMELFIRVMGNNLFSLSIAGALCVSSAFFQKIGNLIIIYGFSKPYDIARNFYHYILNQLHIDGVDPRILVLIILGTYVIIGFTAALTGFKIGRASQNKPYTAQGYKAGNMQTDAYFVVDTKFKFSLFLFWTHIVLIPAGLLLFNYFSLTISALFTALYSSFSIFKYKRSLRRLKKPILWIQIILLILFASIFGNNDQLSGSLFKMEGFLIGLDMSVRAIFIVLAFASFGVELRNPRIKNYLFKHGFNKIYAALGLSFSALPLMIEAMPKPKYFLFHPIESFSNMMGHAKEWLEVFESTSTKNPTRI